MTAQNESDGQLSTLQKVAKDYPLEVALAEIKLWKEELKYTEEKIKSLQSKIEIYERALEFYADKSNWGYNEKPKNKSHLAGIIENHDCGWCKTNEKFVGGKRARQALEEGRKV